MGAVYCLPTFNVYIKCVNGKKADIKKTISLNIPYKLNNFKRAKQTCYFTSISN